jgi:hypothetical protein
MDRNKIKFVVIAQARSGSTLLRKALHSHPDIVCHGEILSRKWINGLVPLNDPLAERSAKKNVLKLIENRSQNVSEFLDNHIYNFNAKAVGFKLIYEDLFLSELREPIIDYICKNDLVIFQLVRLNSLAAFVSRKRMSMYGISHSDSPLIKRNCEDQSLMVKPLEIQRYISKQTLFRNKVDMLFSNVDTIFYEKISSGYSCIIKKLGVDFFPMKVKLAKLNINPIKESISNYNDVKEFDIGLV